jgi:hypothetical protein
MTINPKKIIIIVLVLIGGYQMLAANVFAQNQDKTQIIFTWEANNYFPANYAGKALPARGTTVTLAAEVIKDGKLIDISQADFLWYLDDELVKRGKGVKEISFRITKREGDSHFVNVIIKTGEEKEIESNLRIPVAAPTVIVDKPYPQNLIKSGEKIMLQAIPYFFNVNFLSELNFTWFINDQSIAAAGDNQLFLTVPVPSQTDQNLLHITAVVEKRGVLNESARAKTILQIY